MNNNKLSQYLRNVAYVSGGVLTRHYGGKVLDNIDNYRNKYKQLPEQNENNLILDNLIELKEQVNGLENSINNLNEDQKKSIELNDELVQKMNEVGDDVNKLNEAKNMVIESPASPEIKALVNERINNVTKSTDGLKEIIDRIFKEGDKFISDLNLDKIYEFLDSLTLLQESALLHIVFFTAIILTLLSIIGIFLSNEIIKYFDLENKFPWLSSYLKLRSKFQRFYLILYTLILFIICIVGIGLNILTLMGSS